MYGLSLFKVEQLKIHGGSNRYWLEKLTLANIVDPSVEKLLSVESETGLFQVEEWANFSTKVSGILNSLLEWLTNAQKDGRRVFGYGAAAKASTIINSINIAPNSIVAIADLSLEKQGRFMPPHGIGIISPHELFFEKPTDVIIFPWNIKSEIAIYLRLNLGDQVRLWCAIPEMHQIELK
jgi:hypothetical protein